jgi:capsule polysaccharide export protein KpsC/LpsZ
MYISYEKGLAIASEINEFISKNGLSGFIAEVNCIRNQIVIVKKYGDEVVVVAYVNGDISVRYNPYSLIYTDDMAKLIMFSSNLLTKACEGF